MSSASSSIATPALMRRTLDWLRTSLLKGMSRDSLKAILGCDLAMGGSPVIRDGPAGSLSPGLRKPVTTFPSALFLSTHRAPKVGSMAQVRSPRFRLGDAAPASCAQQHPAGTQAGSPPPSTPRMRRGRWRDCFLAEFRTSCLCSRHAAPSARCRARRKRMMCSVHRQSLRTRIFSSRRPPTDRDRAWRPLKCPSSWSAVRCQFMGSKKACGGGTRMKSPATS